MNQTRHPPTSHSNADVVPDMTHKVAMVTGASDGIGKATALGLAKLGCRVVMVCRDPERGRAAQEEIRSASANAAVHPMLADLSRQNEVGKLADDFLRAHTSLHVLVNNAGVNVRQRILTADRIELNFAVNHLAYFLLSNLLVDVLRRNAPSRIVNVASAAEAMGKIDFDDLMCERGYSALRAYNQSKLANVVFTYELARRLGGSGVTVNCLHPGIVKTKITRGMTGLGRIIAILARPFALTPEDGAASVLRLACSHDVANVTGRYFDRRQEKLSSPRSRDVGLGSRLWQVSEQLTQASVV